MPTSEAGPADVTATPTAYLERVIISFARSASTSPTAAVSVGDTPSSPWSSPASGWC